MSEVPQGGQGPGPLEEVTGGGPESVTCHEDLLRLLAEQFARADVSLRELQSRAEKAGGARLPRTTCADMLAGRRFPKKAVMVAFPRGCRVPDHRLPAWERAWERVRVSRMPAGSGEDRGAGPTGGPPPARVVTTPGDPGTASTTGTSGEFPSSRRGRWPGSGPAGSPVVHDARRTWAAARMR